MKTRVSVKQFFLLISLLIFLGGCSKTAGGQNYQTKEEAGKAALTFLEKKYQRKFTLVGDGELKESKNIKYFTTKFKDEKGLEAEIELPQEKKSSFTDVLDSGISGTTDTYSETYYTKLTREAIEPLFKDEPFEKYFISIDNAGAAKGDLSLSADAYFQKSETSYTLYVIVKDGQTAEDYADSIYPFYQKLITEQKNNFGMFVYANQKQIFAITYVNSKAFNANKPYEEVLEDVIVGLSRHRPQPEEKYLRSNYYNGEE